MRWTLVLALAAIGCGGENDGPPPGATDWTAPDAAAAPVPSLEGSWLTEGTMNCWHGLTFSLGASTFVQQKLCQAGATQFLDQTLSGQIDLSTPGRIIFRPRATTCPSKPEVDYYVPFSVSADGKQLTLAYDDATVIFVRPPPAGMPGTGATLLNGCFETATAFTPHPLGPVMAPADAGATD